MDATFDFLAPELNYIHMREYDFEAADRPAIFPHASYGKYIYPWDKIHGRDWEAVCPKFLAEQDHK